MIIAEEDRVGVRLTENPRFGGGVVLLISAGPRDVEDGGDGRYLGSGHFQHGPPVHERMRGLGGGLIGVWRGGSGTVLVRGQSGHS